MSARVRVTVATWSADLDLDTVLAHPGEGYWTGASDAAGALAPIGLIGIGIAELAGDRLRAVGVQLLLQVVAVDGDQRPG